MKKTILLFLLTTTPFIGISQDIPEILSLQDAINYALKNNRNAKNAQRSVEAANELKWETIASGLPQIGVSLDYNYWLKQQISLIPSEFFGGNPGEFSEIIFGTKQTMSVTANLSQKIFDGSYLVGLQSAKVFLEISKNAQKKTVLDIRKSVINAYGNVLLAEESEKILEKNLQVLEINFNETSKIYENGLIEEESVEQLQITLSRVKNNLLNARRLKDLAYKMLNLTLGIDVDSTVNLSDNLKFLTDENIVISLLNADEDIEQTIDYKIAKNDTDSKELLVKLEKSKSLPTLNAFINGGYLGNNNSFDFLNTSQKWFGLSLIGVTMSIPIFSSGMRIAATKRAKINLEQSRDNLIETKQIIKLEILKAKSAYKFAIEEYNNNQKNLRLAERIEKKNQIKFFEGISSSFDLRQAQAQLYKSQQELLQSMLEVINKKADLETALNQIPKN
ncbi:TolC family protein [Flavobacteriaceae bacterium]|nr:TolC family protein [Flavobacteriaceae bacterium]MDC3269108.1 TolC family protein [Flavobacteriaceae bacterium]